MKSVSKIILILTTIIFFNCSEQKPAAETNEAIIKETIIEEEPKTNDTISYNLIYEGTFPCKDCEGIKTTLKLSTHDNKYLMIEKYLGKENGFTSSGNFNVERGYEKDRDATLYILNDDKPVTEQIYFVRETNKKGILTKLDYERKRSSQDLSLKEVSAK